MSTLDRKNKLWEGSRMFLPEHRKNLLEHYQEAQTFTPPILSDEAWQEINRLIIEGLHDESPLLIYYVKQKSAQQFCGFIEKVNPYEHWLKVTNGQTTCTIHFKNIYRVEYP
ncbi:YolD-like family protein [Thermoflavimicrobium daqui]|uniref:YolD-like family protein n=1 Tax=Thermoflavimicrobium daqui TaxID=2137476 RepID=A0A364K5Q3_9BACL|nr:YolD-like family protein [Thermoflavimicrobium daqui]RAL25598.1 hypothetical protein DL897_05835 [Thermoflavimicrobium daqui]